MFLKSWVHSRSPKVRRAWIRHIDHVNVNLFLKLGWRLMSNPHSLWANLLKAKYFPKTSFLRSQCKAQNLALWKGIQNCKTILFDRVCWSIVDGRSVRIFEDCWLPDHTWPIQRLANAPSHQLICTPSGHWDMELISEVFDSDTTVAILNTPINKFDPVGRDKFT